MHAMQYEIKLPADYDMKIIKERVRKNGNKTDGFEDLLVKAYLIKEKASNKMNNVYAPLYLWKSEAGMNRFIFDGYYDNIISSFGWHEINIGIPFKISIDEKIKNSNYLIEEYISIQPSSTMTKLNIQSQFKNINNCLSEVIIYNPEKWKFVKFSFVDQIPKNLDQGLEYYKVLHISES
ncbi:DUF4865 family protein [Mammaliicoccus sp. Dog046]|uniref:DUF4865 family protein n=1 Tax=Mammaliicoccus sp. Dog046 TaxID=3034233 RepID=UPI002B2597BF|nr:DUF4865 family protein [Mammaliicoccus sp. Dog046]WQK85626.1 DUF4865 family protein [Mammaliicoccus sp. Dog046]